MSDGLALEVLSTSGTDLDAWASDLTVDTAGTSCVNRSLNSSILSVIDTVIVGRAGRGVVDRVLPEEPDS